MSFLQKKIGTPKHGVPSAFCINGDNRSRTDDLFTASDAKCTSWLLKMSL